MGYFDRVARKEQLQAPCLMLHDVTLQQNIVQPATSLIFYRSNPGRQCSFAPRNGFMGKGPSLWRGAGV